MKPLLNEEYLESVYMKRPRKSVPIFAFLWMILAAVGLFVFVSLYYIPSILDSIGGLFDWKSLFLLEESYAEPFSTYMKNGGYWALASIEAVLALPSFCLFYFCAMRRKNYVPFIITLPILAIISIAFVLFLCVPMVQDLFNQINIGNIFFSFGDYVVLAYCALVVFFDFLLLFYNKLYIGKLSLIGKYRKERKLDFDSRADKRAFEKTFYHTFKKKQWPEFIANLLGSFLTPGKGRPMPKEVLDFIVEDIIRAESTLARAEIAIMNRDGKYDEIRRLREEILADVKLLDAGDYTGIIKRKAGRASVRGNTKQQPQQAPKPAEEKPIVTPTPEPAPKEEPLIPVYQRDEEKAPELLYPEDRE